MASGKRQCLGCKEHLSFRTVRRHLKHGCGRQRTRQGRLQKAVIAAMHRARREGFIQVPSPPRPHHLSHQDKRRRPPAAPPPPALRARLDSPRHQPTDDVLMHSPEYERPDMRFDTPGAGPGPSTQARSPRFASPSLEDDESAQITLRDVFPWLENLSAEAYLASEYLSQLVRIGEHKLPRHHRLLVQAFNYKVNTDISGIAYSKLPRAFPDRLGDLPTHAQLRTRIGVISGMRGARIDCCVNSCVAYTGPYADERVCPYCPEPRYKPHPRVPSRLVPRRSFQYLPVIPRLINLFRDPVMAQKLRYRSRHCRDPNPDFIADIFDGDYYRGLLGQRVTVGGETLKHEYFSKPTDIALGLSTDGFGPFKSRKQMCWPLILFNYNLHPSIRTQLEHILCIGVIPGPNAPKDLCTYLEPLIKELEDLARGVPAFDSVDGHTFSLRAYLLACFGDMPAVAKLMAMKGPNGKFPCRACHIEGVKAGRVRGHQGVGRKKTTLYTPLSRASAKGRNTSQHYDPLCLPRRTHAEHLKQALEVEAAINDSNEILRARDTGINGLSPLARLSSLEFPTSFPHDFMHLLFENVLPTLLDLWTRSGRWRNFGTPHDDYILDQDVWAAIAAAAAASGDTIPSAFGCRVPNFKERRGERTSESMLLFATLLGPALLRSRFRRPRYYDHFVRLVKLINLCIGLKVQRVQVQEIRKGFAQWVKDYEAYYYRNDPERLPACTLPLHALLHIADDIEAMGPVWAYWAFPMERFCGAIARSNKSRRYPYSSINRHVLQVAQLSQIKLTYGMTEELDLEQRRSNIASGTSYPAYSDLVFVAPSRHQCIHPKLIDPVATFLSRHTRLPERIVRRALAAREFTSWGKMQRVVRSDTGDITGGDLIRGHHIVGSQARETRDATHVQYYSTTSYWRWNGGRAIHLAQPELSFGRAELFLVIDRNFLRTLSETAPAPFALETLVLAVVSPIPYLKLLDDAGLIQYRLNAGNYARPEVIDATDVDCLVGRVTTPLKTTYIVERDTVVGQIDMLDVTVNPD